LITSVTLTIIKRLVNRNIPSLSDILINKEEHIIMMQNGIAESKNPLLNK
jgi:hypothetical protein